MPKWRQRELQQQSGRRAVRLGGAMRPSGLTAIVALAVAAVALWQAMNAQARADRLEHDLGVAVARLRDGGVEPAGAVRPSDAGAPAAPLSPPPAQAAPSAFSPPQTGVR